MDKPKKRRDRTHDPKPTSGWWADEPGHRAAAMKNNSRGGRGSLRKAGHGLEKVAKAPGEMAENLRKHVAIPLSASGRRRKV